MFTDSGQFWAPFFLSFWGKYEITKMWAELQKTKYRAVEEALQKYLHWITDYCRTLDRARRKLYCIYGRGFQMSAAAPYGLSVNSEINVIWQKSNYYRSSSLLAIEPYLNCLGFLAAWAPWWNTNSVALKKI